MCGTGTDSRACSSLTLILTLRAQQDGFAEPETLGKFWALSESVSPRRSASWQDVRGSPCLSQLEPGAGPPPAFVVHLQKFDSSTSSHSRTGSLGPS